MGYSKAVQAKLFNYSDRDEYQRFMMRASGDDNYPAINDDAHEGSTHVRDEYVHTLAQTGNLKMDLRAVERVIVFLNGDYWGVYGLRERPVDHDYTQEVYDQDKYHLQYILTWGNTWTEYGGQQALDDWLELRDFVLSNDMGDSTNYQYFKDQFQVQSLIDFMIINLAVVSSDWLNYNTAWWRGIHPDGGHKKWGYSLWDNDATFDYYINYSGVPNTDPDAVPCDIEEIGEYMDEFFGESEPIEHPDSCETILNGSCPYPPTDSIFLATIQFDSYCCDGDWDNDCQNIYNYIESLMIDIDPETCPTIINGSSPYPATDSIFVQTIMQDPYCCETDWDGICQGIYDDLLNNPGSGTVPGNGAGEEVTIGGNVGKHEKIFLKLQEESTEFRQLYYSRQADLMNTVFSCENMMHTLDSLLAIIEPEMPRQIERWGGSMDEWRDNVETLKSFVEQRCQLMDDGIVECYQLTGPFNVVVDVQPQGAGTVEFNTLNLNTFPWSGDYFGGMQNLVETQTTDDSLYTFSHWETTNGSTIFPDSSQTNIAISIAQADTLIAVFDSIIIEIDTMEIDTMEVDTMEIDTMGMDTISALTQLASNLAFTLAPNPTKGYATLSYELSQAAKIEVDLYSILGNHLIHYPQASGKRNKGQHQDRLNLSELSAGAYLLHIKVNEHQKVLPIMLID